MSISVLSVNSKPVTLYGHAVSMAAPPDPAVTFCFGNCTNCYFGNDCHDMWFPVCMANRQVGDIMTVCFCAEQYLNTEFQATCFWISENGSAWTSCGASPTSFTRTGIDYNDSLCLRIMICDADDPPSIAEASVWIHSTPAVFTTGSGTLERCTPYCCTVYTGIE